MDSQGAAASAGSPAAHPAAHPAGSSAAEAGGGQWPALLPEPRPDADPAVAAEFVAPSGGRVATEIASDGDDTRRSGDDTVVMAAPESSHSAEAQARAQAPANQAQAPANQAQAPADDVQEPPQPQGPQEHPQKPQQQHEELQDPEEPQERQEPPDARTEEHPQPHVRVDGRLLEAALLNLRKRVAAVPLVFEIDGSAAIKAERAKLISQIDDYLLPRVRRSAAPILVALVGSTGAGKSTLINSIVGTKVSATGVRRPTTNSPVLACHPDDIDWFAENNFLPTLPRVRQEGLARPGRDGLLVLAASEGMPRGVALLDTPDIDSVVKAHHEFAYQFLDASDLWLFVTSASRYADSPVWEVLQHARDRRAALGVVLSRVPQAFRDELTGHFQAMLDANGITSAERFVIPETPLLDGMLPPDVYQEIRDWLVQTATRQDRRVSVLTQTMSGVLDTFRSRVPKVAAHVEAQVVLRSQLRKEAAGVYTKALTEAAEGLRGAALLRGEVLARWQDCVDSGDLAGRRAAAAAKAKDAAKRGRRAARRGPQRQAALSAALRESVESFIVALADRAAEYACARWQDNAAGALLLANAATDRVRDANVERVFSDAFGDQHRPVASPLFNRAAPDLRLRAARTVAGWQDQLSRQAGTEAGGLVMAVAMLAEGSAASDSPIEDQATALLTPAQSGFDPSKARGELEDRIRLLFDEELLGFITLIDAAGPCDDVAAVRLYQAEYSLEAIR